MTIRFVGCESDDKNRNWGTGRVFTTAVVPLNVPQCGCLQTSLSDLKMISVSTGKSKSGEGTG